MAASTNTTRIPVRTLFPAVAGSPDPVVIAIAEFLAEQTAREIVAQERANRHDAEVPQ